MNAEHLKKVRDDVDAGGGDGSAAGVEAEIAGAGESEVTGHVLIGAAVGAELVVGVSGVGCAGEAAFAGRRCDPHQPLRVGEGQRAQQERVHNAEDGNVGADAESQDKNGDDGEAAVTAQRAEGVLQILQNDIELDEAAHFAVLFLCLLDPTEADQCLTAGLFRRQTAAQVFFDCQFEMYSEFGFEFRVPLFFMEERTHSIQSFTQGTHQSSPSAGMANTRSTMLERRRQCAASFSNCLRPLLVME